MRRLGERVAPIGLLDYDMRDERFLQLGDHESEKIKVGSNKDE